ncbi:hypothetical protein [Agromyces laixinhei]|uniref:hypothetical protein n=1 Tax=Agromyces laixinhei TaxID=2585717 RepID=UPI001116993D|nr:hypothetical protein [Agromyces laixinhei]
MVERSDANMRMRRARRGAVLRLLLVVAVSGVGLTACTAGSDTLPAPVVVDLGEIDGTSIEVVEGNVIDLTGDDETYTEWTAEIDDPAIARFTPGRDDGSAQFNPGITAIAEGSTGVTLENGETGDTVSFTVEVAPATSGY